MTDHSALIERLEGGFLSSNPHHSEVYQTNTLLALAAAALRDLTEWRDIETAPKDGTVIIAMGRYVAATAGFPTMVHFMAGSWRQIGQGVMPSMVCWAWKPRDVLGAWPSEPLPSAPNQAKEAVE